MQASLGALPAIVRNRVKIESEPRRLRSRGVRGMHLLPALLGLAAAVLAWQAVAMAGGYPEFILPRPASVLNRFALLSLDGTLWRHASLTAQEALGGFLIGVIFATIVGYPLAKLRLLERVVSPYLVASQSIPVVAIAPLLVLWFGFGMTSKLLAAALISFFPVLVNVIVGVRSIDVESRQLMRTFSASAFDVLRKLEVPAALPIYLGGVRVGITLSVIGAVVGEFVGADGGLGYLIAQSRGLFDTVTLFVALLTLMGMALAFYVGVVCLERLLLSGRQRD
jgi:putative riboflavin transport system permease protein